MLTTPTYLICILLLSIILSIRVFLFLTNRKVTQRVWFQFIVSYFCLNKMLYKMRLIRILFFRGFPQCCKGSKDKPLPSTFVGRMSFIYIKFREVLFIYRMLLKSYDKKGKKGE